MASRSIICQSRRLGQIIDLRDTGKSRCFAITESNNCFIFHWSPSLFLNYLESDLCHCQARAIARRRKAWFHYAWAEYYLQPYTKPNTVGRQTIICRQFICRSPDRLSSNEKKKNLHRIIRSIITKIYKLSGGIHSHTAAVLCNWQWQG